MPYFLVADFRGGLDVRKSPWTAEAGTLQTFVDGHVTRGGEIEKRKVFADQGSLQANTFSLMAGRPGGGARELIVVGSDAAPDDTLPAGVVYQQLQHPDGGIDMTGVAASTLFDGRPYVVANFADGSQWHFYDGVLVTDWGAGVVRDSMTTTDDIAEHLRQLIDADADFTATRTGDIIEVVGLPGVDYPTASETTNSVGGVNDQTITITEIEEAITPVPKVAAIGEFAILEGSDDNGVANYIEKVRVDVGGVFTELISSNVAYNTGPELTAFDLVTAINAGTGTHGYTATTKYGRVFISAPQSAGAAANGRVLEVIAKGDVILYNGSFSITTGSAGAGNELIQVKVNGASILSSAVAWATSDSATAAAVASNIRAFASSPKMNAKSNGSTVYVSPEKIRSDDAITYTLNVEAGGDVGVGDGSQPVVIGDNPGYGDFDPVGDSQDPL